MAARAGVNTPNLTYLTKRGIFSHGNGSVRDSGERSGALGVLAEAFDKAGGVADVVAG